MVNQEIKTIVRPLIICMKTKFRTKEDAMFTVERIKQKNIKRNVSDRKEPIDAYLCPDCNSWHLTSKMAYDTLTGQVAALTAERNEFKTKYEELKKVQEPSTRQLDNFKAKISNLHETIKNLENKLNRRKEDSSGTKIRELEKTIQELNGRIALNKFETKSKETSEKQIEELKRQNAQMKTKIEQIQKLLS